MWRQTDRHHHNSQSAVVLLLHQLQQEKLNTQCVTLTLLIPPPTHTATQHPGECDVNYLRESSLLFIREYSVSLSLSHTHTHSLTVVIKPELKYDHKNHSNNSYTAGGGSDTQEVIYKPLPLPIPSLIKNKQMASMTTHLLRSIPQGYTLRYHHHNNHHH